MVEYITIKGKEYPIRIGYSVMKAIQAYTGLQLKEAMKKHREDVVLHETILYAALKAGAFAEDQEFTFERDNMEGVLDLCFEEYLEIFTSGQFFPDESMVDKVNDSLGELTEEGEKKKVSTKPKTRKRKT